TTATPASSTSAIRSSSRLAGAETAATEPNTPPDSHVGQPQTGRSRPKRRCARLAEPNVSILLGTSTMPASDLHPHPFIEIAEAIARKKCACVFIERPNIERDRLNGAVLR